MSRLSEGSIALILMTEKILTLLFVFINSIVAATGYAYEIGCYGGRPLVERYGRWILMGRRELDWADRFFQRWGEMAVFIARLLPVIRTFIALPAGVARMPRGKFHIYTFLGSWPWCFALAYFGMKLGENWRSLGKYFHQFDAIIGVLLIGGIGWFVWSHWQNRLRPLEK